MKAVIGTDLARTYESAVDLLVALELPGLEAVVVNVIEPVVTAASSGEFASMGVMSLLMTDLLNAGQQVVKDASTKLAEKGVPCETLVLTGSATGCLNETSKERGADLVAIGAPVRSLFEKFFTGSVSRDLAVSCERSVLIGRQSPKDESGLTVVFAHDHSEYCDRALAHFLEMRPAGVAKVVLVTVDTSEGAIVAMIERDTPQMPDDIAVTVKEFLAARTAAAKTKLESLGCPVEARVEEGDTNQVLHRTMKDTGADLLVMGAKGHGFVERLFLGSIAMHHVVREDYNVMLVRA